MALLKKKGAAPEGEEKLTYRERKAAKKAEEKAAEKAGRKIEPKEQLSKAELKTLKEQRKHLRRDLRRQGIKKKHDFELFANEVGLGYPKGTTLGFVHGALAKASAIWGVATAGVTVPIVIASAAGILAGTFLFSYVSEMKGHFTINLTSDMLQEGFQLSESPEFDDTKTRLFAEEIVNSNATSLYEINRGLHTEDGSHNGPGYLAYTFYIKNAGTMTTNYGYTMNLLSDSLKTSAAAWVMFYEEDKQIIYAQALEDGKPENLYGYPDAPFIETAYDPERQYTTVDGKAGVVTTPFIDNYTVLQGYVEDFEPGEVRKYTVVTWLEGDDPDCNNDILGGHVGFNIQFNRLGDEHEGYFKGLYRTDYHDFYSGKTQGLVYAWQPDPDREDSGTNPAESREEEG